MIRWNVKAWKLPTLSAMRQRLSPMVGADDMEAIVVEALQTMKRNQIENRERAVIAITECNAQEKLFAEHRRACAELEEEVRRARHDGPLKGVIALERRLKNQRELARNLESEAEEV